MPSFCIAIKSPYQAIQSLYQAIQTAEPLHLMGGMPFCLATAPHSCDPAPSFCTRYALADMPHILLKNVRGNPCNIYPFGVIIGYTNRKEHYVMADKISLKHGYTLHFNEDDTLSLNIETEDYGTIEIEGRKGNLIDASDFMSYLGDDTDDIKSTLDDLLYGTTEWLKDFGVDDETIEAICKDLTPWFEKYAISKADKIRLDISNLENFIKFREEHIATIMRDSDSLRKEVDKRMKDIRSNTIRIDELNKDIENYRNTISVLKAALKGNPKTYRCKMQVVLELNADIEADTREDAEQKFLDFYRGTPYADMDYVNGDYAIEEVR